MGKRKEKLEKKSSNTVLSLFSFVFDPKSPKSVSMATFCTEQKKGLIVPTSKKGERERDVVQIYRVFHVHLPAQPTTRS